MRTGRARIATVFLPRNAADDHHDTNSVTPAQIGNVQNLVVPTSEGRVIGRISAWFLTPDSAVNLAVVRIVLCVTIFRGAASAAFNPRSLPDAPTVAPDLLGFVLVELPRGQTAMQIVAAGLALSTLAGALGFKTRWAMAGVLLFGAYHFGVPQIFGKVDHNHHILWVSLVLALAPCGDALSLDSRGRAPARSPKYGFPLRVIWILLGLAYFFAGLWKLLLVGPAWAAPRNMSGIMWSEWTARGGYEPIVDISANRLLLTAGGVMTLAVELGFVLLVIHKRTRWLAILGGIGFHLGVGITIGIWFVDLPFFYVALVDWASLVRKVRGRAPGVPSTDSTPPRWIEGAACGALLIAVVLAGSDRIIDGWPVASYPDFAYQAKVISVLDVTLDGAPVAEAGTVDLSGIQRHRLLSAAAVDDDKRSELVATLLAAGVCDEHAGADLLLTRQQFVTRVGPPESHGEREHVSIATCP